MTGVRADSVPVSGCRHVAVKACARSQDQSLIHEQLWGSELLTCTCVAVGSATGTRVAVSVCIVHAHSYRAEAGCLQQSEHQDPEPRASLAALARGGGGLWQEVGKERDSGS